MNINVIIIICVYVYIYIYMHIYIYIYIYVCAAWLQDKSSRRRMCCRQTRASYSHKNRTALRFIDKVKSDPRPEDATYNRIPYATRTITMPFSSTPHNDAALHFEEKQFVVEAQA